MKIEIGSTIHSKQLTVPIERMKGNDVEKRVLFILVPDHVRFRVENIFRPTPGQFSIIGSLPLRNRYLLLLDGDFPCRTLISRHDANGR